MGCVDRTVAASQHRPRAHLDVWRVSHWDQDKPTRRLSVCLFGTYDCICVVLFFVGFFFLCLRRTRLDTLQWGHTWMNVRHDWLANEEGCWQEVTSCFITPRWSPALMSGLSLSLILARWRVLFPASCAVLAHAGSQHQSALLRHLWVFNHALPQPLLLPVRVHPVHLAAVAQACRAGDANVGLVWGFFASPALLFELDKEV